MLIIPTIPQYLETVGIAMKLKRATILAKYKDQLLAPY